MATLSNNLITIWNKLKSVYTAVSNDISGVETSLALKENVGNKSNELTSSLSQYPTSNAVNSAVEQIQVNLQNLADLIPYIKQTTGISTDDVMSQKAVTDAIQSAMGSAGVFHYMGAVTDATALPTQDVNDFDIYLNEDTGEFVFWVSDAWHTINESVDLTNYATNGEEESAIFDVTDDLLNLTTTNKGSLVGAINENKSRIDNNVTSISGLQSDLTGEISARTTQYSTLNSAINTNATNISNINTLIDLTSFESYILANPIEV